jgi:hypothetical protein
MSGFGNVGFDPETPAILEGVLDEAWVSIQAQRQGNITRAVLAERILNLAVNVGARALRAYQDPGLPLRPGSSCSRETHDIDRMQSFRRGEQFYTDAMGG